jgi:hypothetical protein
MTQKPGFARKSNLNRKQHRANWKNAGNTSLVHGGDSRRGLNWVRNRPINPSESWPSGMENISCIIALQIGKSPIHLIQIIKTARNIARHFHR